GGEKVVALFGEALNADGAPRKDAGDCPTLLFFYGNAMTANDCWVEFGRFRRTGVNVLIPDFLGYGMSGGEAGEPGLYATADAAYDYLTHDRHVASAKIISAGRSIGTAAAIDLASRRPVGAVATFSAFTSMVDVAHQVLPWYPTSLLLRHRFESK